MRRRALLAVILLGCLGVLLLPVAWSLASTRHRAEQLLRDVRRLDLSAATLDDVKRLARKYPPEEVYYATPCTDGYCQVSITIQNTWLHRLRLAPQTSFEAFFDVQEGRVHYFEVGFVKVEGPFSFRARVSEVIPPTEEAFERTFVESCTGNTHLRSLKLVTAHILPSATAEEKERAFAFNFDCLTRIGGCKRWEFMPSICTDWAEPDQAISGESESSSN